MAKPFAFAPSPVLRVKQSPGFYDGPGGSGFGMLDSEVFAPEFSAEGAYIRALRIATGRSLRDAAAQLELGIVDLSSLERGHAHFVNFNAARARLVELWCKTEVTHV